MVARVVVIGDEGLDLGFEIARQVVVFQQNAVFEGLVPALDLALGHRMIRRATDVFDVAGTEPFGEVARDIAGAVAPVTSLAWRLRNEGYRTVCLHPFDRGFFRRDLTLTALGFETFLGRESLGGSRQAPYRPDPDLAHQVLRVLDGTGPRSFIFVITMGNHGPWFEAGPPIEAQLRQRFDPSGLPQGGQFLRYLDGLARSDEMLRILAEGLGPRGRDGVLGFYGDHQPSLPETFGHFGFDEWASDYILVDSAATSARRFDMPADHLPRVILDHLRERNAVAGRRAAALGAA